MKVEKLKRASLPGSYKEIIVMIVVSILLVAEVFSGAMRYFFTILGLTSFIYMPKVLALLLVIIEFFNIKFRKQHFFVCFLFVLSCCIAVLNGATLNNIAFSMFIYVPTLFAIMFGKVFENNSKWFVVLISICFVASLIGELLDYSTSVPWKGFAYQIGNQTIEANREWSTMGIDRLSGFARLSPALASMLAVYSLFLLIKFDFLLVRIGLFSVTFLGILLTTNKATLGAYVLVCLYLFLFSRIKFRKIVFIPTIVIGLIIPLLSVMYKYSVADKLNGDFEKLVLSSFDDRLVTTWPGTFEILTKKDALVTGTGFGTVGSGVTNYPIRGMGGHKLKDLAVIDSTALFLYAIFGIFGVYLYTLQYKVLNKLVDLGDRMALILECCLLCIIIISWTSDVFGDLTPAFFIGMAIYKSTTVRNKRTI